MRKTTVILIALTILFVFTACASTPQLDSVENDTAQSSSAVWEVSFASGIKSVRLSDEEATALDDILSSDDWKDDVTDCSSDVTLRSEGWKHLRYCSDCGTFNDIQRIRSLKLSSSERASFNKLLQKYGTLGVVEDTDIHIETPDSLIS